MVIALVVFIIILLILVLSHEAGHFWSARAFGIKVEEFGFGIPPRIWTLKKDKKGTIYSINWLPFGGFVKIFGEEGGDLDVPESFSSKSGWVRALVLASGVLANLVLAFFTFTILSVLGVPQAVSDEDRAFYTGAKITVMDVSAGSPAASSGILAGDEILALDQEKVTLYPQTIDEIQNFIAESRGQSLRITLMRGKEEFKIQVIPRENPPPGEGPLGISLGFIHFMRSPWYLAPMDGARLTWQALKATVIGFGNILESLLKREAIGVQIAGPVGIFNITASALNLGLNAILMLVAIFSINLAIINILPFPGLDGGRFFFLLLEAAYRRRISPKISAIVHGAGLAILIALMVLVTYHDLTTIF